MSDKEIYVILAQCIENYTNESWQSVLKSLKEQPEIIEPLKKYIENEYANELLQIRIVKESYAHALHDTNRLSSIDRNEIFYKADEYAQRERRKIRGFRG